MCEKEGKNMKCLFSIQPALAHLHLIIPIAHALLDAEHELAFATAKSFCPLVEHAGIRCFPAGLDWLAEQTDRTFPERKAIPLEEHGWFDVGVIFAHHCPPPMIDDLLRIANDWKPDVIVRDMWEFGGCIAAEMLGIPHAVIGLSGGVIVPSEDIKVHIADPLNEIRQRYNLPPDPDLDMLYRYLRLDLIPPSYRPPHIKPLVTTHTIRPVSFDQTVTGEIPEWLDDLPYRRMILVTLGTVNNQHPEIFQTMLAGLREEAINVIMTIGSSLEPSMFGSQPDHIRITSYIPYSLVLDRLDAVVMHGGFTTVLAVLSQGLPVVFVPIATDHTLNAQRFTQLGAGLIVTRHELTPQSIRDAVRTVLHDPSYRQAARRIAQELRGQPGPEHAAHLLTRLAREKQPILTDDQG
jgi:UDP:flavonoid glycosyltransferase YjiC (YdhE family)